MKENGSITLEELIIILTETEESFTVLSELDEKTLKTFKKCMLEGYTDCNIHDIYILVKGVIDVIASDFNNTIVGNILKRIIIRFVFSAKKHGYFKEVTL